MGQGVPETGMRPEDVAGSWECRKGAGLALLTTGRNPTLPPSAALLESVLPAGAITSAAFTGCGRIGRLLFWLLPSGHCKSMSDRESGTLSASLQEAISH